ncbi:WD40/YVTN/BNR-like repeat-containing protein [Labilibacter marinus]|uniref:WD40/YVTN/BNR-like repeat-containing protein n=1 Tax=Labilibacter marinus TaxID=1477105 RepID=UPI00083556F0|nr:sialidase family protein [Labilibacter marinus]
MNLKKGLLALCLLVAINANSQKAKQINKEAFFKEIKTKRVESDKSIEWKNFGPGMSGYNEEFWCHPTDVNVMFMGPDMHVSYGTWDNGKSWHTIKDYDGDGKCMERVLDIVFSRQNPDFGLALERRGKIFKTTDRGRTWDLIYTIPRDTKSSYNAHTKMAIHPNDDDIWFVGAGDFWNVKSNHRSQELIHGKKHSRASYGYVLKTSDHGKTWKKVATDISEDLDVARIVINPAKPSQMYIATSHGFFVSNDTGDTWSESGKGLPNNLPRDLTSYYNAKTKEFVLYLVEQTVYEANGKSINTKGGVYKSTNGGKNWESITGNLGVDFNQINDTYHRSNYYKVLSYWFGVNSKKVYPEFPENTYSIFNRIVVNPLNKDEIYLVANQRHDKSFGPGDAWKTEDGGKNWKICARAGTYWNQQKDKEYWASKGIETGANVEFAHVGIANAELNEVRFGNRMLAINAEGEAFIGVQQQTQRTSDGGKTWKQVDDYETAPGSNAWVGRGDSNLPGRFMLLETGKKDRFLLCSGEHGLWETAPLGNYPDKDAVAVKQIEGQVNDHSGNHGLHSASTVAVHPNDPNIIYTIGWRQEHRGKMRRSVDGGKTWENISTIFEGNNPSFRGIAPQYSLMVDPKNPDNMYFCAIRHTIQEVGASPKESVMKKGKYGVYRSNDGGFNWTLSNEGLPELCSVRRLTMDPKNPKVIYASVNQRNKHHKGGLYKSVDGALNWEKVIIPAQIASVNNLTIDRNTHAMYMSTGSSFGAYEAGGVWKSRDDGKSWKKFFKAPYVWQAEVSPINSDIVTIIVPYQKDFKNPGLYLTHDGGKSWMKINKGIGQPDKMTDFKPDPYNENFLWCAAWGSGWFKATIK